MMSHQAVANSGKRVIILGGGLAGLTFAHYLRNFLAYYRVTDRIRKITIFEANDYMGGSIKSNVFDDNVVHELGPRSVRTQGSKAKNTCALVDQLGLSDRVLTIDPKSAASKDRYVYRNNQMWSVPSGISKLFNKLPGTDERLLKVVWRDLSNSQRMDLSQYTFNDPPIYDFIKHRFGENAADAILDPLMRGITAGDCRLWSTRGIFAEMLDKEQTHGGIIRALSSAPPNKLELDDLYANDCLQSELLQKFTKENVWSFNIKTGLQTLPEHLSNSLLNSNDDDVVAIYNRTKALSVKFSNELKEDNAPCSVAVETIDGDQITIEGEHLVSALPAVNFSSILNSSNEGISHELKEATAFLSAIPHAPVGCVTVEYRNIDKELPTIANSFGFLTHSKAGSRLLGVSFDSASFPTIDRDVGAFRMTCMMGGAWANEVFGTSDMNMVTDTQLEQIALEELEHILNIKQDPYRISTMLWKVGIAQYRPGHVGMLQDMRDKIKKARLPLTLIGQSYDGVAVNEVIYSARIAASKFAKSLCDDN